MVTPEDIQKLFIRNLSGIIIDADRLGMVSKALVGWIYLSTSRITYLCFDNTPTMPEPGIRTPESAHAEGCYLLADR
jgi:hypothetical protein